MKSLLGRVLLVPAFVLLLGTCFALFSFCLAKFTPKSITTTSTPLPKMADDKLLYSGDLFFKPDSLKKGISQSLYGKTADGQERLVASFSATDHKEYYEYFEDFVTEIPKSNRYAFFYRDSIAPVNTEYRSSYMLLAFDKQTKKIIDLHQPTLIDNPYEFSPDYNLLAILRSEMNPEYVASGHTEYVDIIDVSTLALKARYYVPKGYSLYAMDYSHNAGRADWDTNKWLSTSTYQVALFKNSTKKSSLWRADAEPHSLAVYPDFAAARAVVPVFAKNLVVSPNDNHVYLRMPDDSWVPTPIDVPDVYDFVQGIADSVPYLIAKQVVMCDSLVIIDRETLQPVATEHLPKDFPGFVCGDPGDFAVSPNGEKVLSVEETVQIVDLKTLQVVRTVETPDQKGLFNGAYRVGAKTRWLSDKQLIIEFVGDKTQTVTVDL